MKGATRLILFNRRYKLYFNPRSREGSDKYGNHIHNAPVYISIHAPVKGATCCSKKPKRNSNISIHAPVKGATCPAVQASSCNIISIHAPVKGATDAWADDFDNLEISIHAPVKGATAFRTILTVSHVAISIHAPVKGATGGPYVYVYRQNDFNPRSREGSDGKKA